MIIKPEISSENLTEKNQLKLKLAGLKSGRVLDAIVLKVFSDNRAELKLLGQKMIVESESRLKEGQNVLLKVAKDTSGKLLLKLLGIKSDLKAGLEVKEKPDQHNQNNPKNVQRNTTETEIYGKILKQERIFKDLPYLEKQSVTTGKTQAGSIPAKLTLGSYKSPEKPQIELKFDSGDLSFEKPLLKGTKLNAVVAEIKDNGNVILNLDGKRVEGKTGLPLDKLPFKKGETIDLTVRENNGKTALLTLSSKRPVSKILISSSDIVPEKQVGFEVKDGDVFKAKVIDITSKRSAVINIKGEDVPVRINTPLSKGENLLLRASVKRGRLSFRVVNQENQPPLNIREGLLKSLGKAGPFENLVDLLKPEPEVKNTINPDDKQNEELLQLKRAVKEISLKSGKTDLDILKTIVKKSGMTLENKLFDLLHSPKRNFNPRAFLESDLKALTMDFLKKFGDDSEAGVKIRSFVETMEQMQLLNRHASDDSGRYLMPVPVFGNEMFRFGQLLIDLNSGSKDEKRKKENVLRVSFMLEMTNLGDLRADFSMLKKGITGAFGVETEDARKVIKKRLPELEKNLNKHGFAVHRIDCFVLDENTLRNSSLTDEILTNKKDGSSGEEVLNIVV